MTQVPGNVAYKKPSSAATQYQSYDSTQAFDDDPTTPGWIGAAYGGGDWVMVDLLTPIKIERITFQQWQASGNSYTAQLQWSSDNSGWNFVLNFPVDLNSHAIYLPSLITARYWRAYFPSYYGSSSVFDLFSPVNPVIIQPNGIGV